MVEVTAPLPVVVHYVWPNVCSDLYVIIPIKETIDITRTQLLMNNDRQVTNQIIALLEIILGQNNFSFQGQIYQPDKGVAMGSPISGT